MRNLSGHRFCDNTSPYCLGHAPLDPVFDHCFASSGFSCVHQLDEVDATVSDTDDTSFDGIDHRVMPIFDLHVPNSAPTHYDDLDALCLQAR
jgi:hypothetical protein